jgi:glycosyltransferase involved in cell wall biosynthesis
MKVLHLNSYYSKSFFYKNLYDRQIENGLCVSVFVPVECSFIHSGFDYGNYTKLSRNFLNIDRFLFISKQLKIYNDLLKRYDVREYDIIHSHSLFTNGNIALMVKRNFNVPFIVAVRNTDLNLFFKLPFLKRLGVEILKEASGVVFLSRSYLEEVMDRYIPGQFRDELLKKTFVIPNGLDDFWLNNKGTPKNILDKKRLKLVYAGKVDKNKNVTATAKAIEILLKDGYDIEFTIVGKAVDQRILNKLIRKNYVNYYSQKPKEELIEIYRENDVFIMPSKTETFGLVYAEAMSQGLPIIYTRGQGFDGQFDDGVVGYSVNPCNYDGIAESIVKVADNYKKLSKRAVELTDRFEWVGIAKQYIRLYREIV